jgi:hypothetical protein
MVLPAAVGKKWRVRSYRVRSYIDLRTIPHGLRGGRDIFHAAVGMPPDVDGIDLVGAFVVENYSE